MTIEELKNRLPDYAKDLRVNLESVLSEGGSPGLAAKQIALVALASAIASRYEPLTEAMAAFATGHASAQECNGARAAAAIMAMHNVYYRFVHSVSDGEYATLPTSLRTGVTLHPGCDRTSFQLACLAVSAINGCAVCMDDHEKALRKRGLGAQAVQSAARIAAAVHAVAVTLEQAGAGAGE